MKKIKQMKSWALRTKIVLLLTLTCAIFMVDTTINAIQNFDKVKENTKVEFQWAARWIESEQSRHIAQGNQVALMVINHIRKGMVEGDCRRGITGEAGLDPEFGQFALADPTGKVFCNSIPWLKLDNVAGQDYFKRANRSLGVGVFDEADNQDPARYSAIMARAMRDKEGHVQNIVMVAMDFSWVKEELEMTHLPATSHLLVLDANGAVVESSPNLREWVDKNISGTAFYKQLPAASQVTYEGAGFTGLDSLIVAHQINTGSGIVRVVFDIPKKDLLRPSYLSLTMSLLVNFVLFSLMLALAYYWINKYFLRKVSLIDHAAGKLADGDMTARINLVDGDELGHLAQSFDSMADALEAKENALNESMHQQELKELAKTRFLASASHDMRQPIAAAKLLVEVLKSTSRNQHQSDLIRKLEQSMEVFSNMLDRLLDISKFDAGLVKPQISAFNLGDLLLWLEQNFAKAAFDKHLRFCLFFPVSKSPIVRSDVGLLQSVLMNLVSNAIKYTERGGILISARMRGDKVLVQVWDTGIGIAEADLPHVFDEFYQVANPQRSREGGLGLGLSICQRAMSVLGGEVRCKSRLGHGSVFELILPLNNEQHEVKPLPIGYTDDKIAGKMSLQGRSVVVVEDDELVAQAMVSLLKGLGGEVQCFHSADDALRSENIEHADYYVVDYMLGGEHNGIQFLNILRQRRGEPINAVMITGDTSTAFIRKAEMFDWPVLHKPVDTAKLIAKLHSQAR